MSPIPRAFGVLNARRNRFQLESRRFLPEGADIASLQPIKSMMTATNAAVENMMKAAKLASEMVDTNAFAMGDRSVRGKKVKREP